MTDDWSLKGKKLYTNSNHIWHADYDEKIIKQWLYSSKDIEILRQKLLEDLNAFLCLTNTPEAYETNSKTIKEIINKRFGVE